MRLYCFHTEHRTGKASSHALTMTVTILYYVLYTLHRDRDWKPLLPSWHFGSCRKGQCFHSKHVLRILSTDGDVLHPQADILFTDTTCLGITPPRANDTPPGKVMFLPPLAVQTPHRWRGSTVQGRTVRYPTGMHSCFRGGSPSRGRPCPWSRVPCIMWDRPITILWNVSYDVQMFYWNAVLVLRFRPTCVCISFLENRRWYSGHSVHGLHALTHWAVRGRVAPHLWVHPGSPGRTSPHRCSRQGRSRRSTRPLGAASWATVPPAWRRKAPSAPRARSMSICELKLCEQTINFVDTQWRIQDLQGGTQPHSGVRQPIIWQNHCQKLHGNERIWTKEDGVSLSPPPPPIWHWFRKIT